MMWARRIGLALLAGAVVGALALSGGLHRESRAYTGGEEWFVEFDYQVVPPVQRKETTQLIEAGSIETDGFKELVFSLGGEFKQSVPNSGKVGVILLPDMDPFNFLLDTEGEFVFPLEVSVEVNGDRMFISEHHVARVAFPRYRAFLYNETSATATVALYIYRSR
jgi:hypothetical protein